MAYENIQIDSKAFTAAGEYFYEMLPAPTNQLMQKTSHGDPVAVYPLSHERDLSDVSGVFLSLQFDGVNFWSLEEYKGSTASVDSYRILRRWRIEEYLCVLKDSWLLSPVGTEKMSGKAFAVESYYNTLAEDCGPGTSYPDRIKLTHPTAAYYHVGDTFYLGDEDQHQDIRVASVPDANTVLVATTLQYVYPAGTPVRLRREAYFFNNESPSAGSAGAAVYRYSIPHYTLASNEVETLQTPTYKGCHESGAYEQTSAATFVTASGIDALKNGNYAGYITYVRGQALLFKEPGKPTGGISYPDGTSGDDNAYQSNVRSMLMDDALKLNRVDLHEIYDLATSVNDTSCVTVNIYRLQEGYTYGDSQGAWTYYNYVVSVMQPMVTSIALTADPAVVVANGVDRALITASVKDQYGQAMNGKRVTFEISDLGGSQGYFLCPEDVSPCLAGCFTWLDTTPHQQAEILTGCQYVSPSNPTSRNDGTAIIEWRSSTEADLVTIVATVQP